MTRYCEEIGVLNENVNTLKFLASASGNPDEVIPALINELEGKTDISPLIEMKEMLAAVDNELKPILRIDFSVVNDIKYYNGIVFKGFIEGIPTSVLSGGQYDKLMQKMNRRSSAIGFAVYLDGLSRFKAFSNEYDVDVLLIYSENTDLAALNKYADSLIKKGERVLVSKETTKNIKYRNIINFDCEVAQGEINA
jgi:ATP phosphoribosyltransferase regulatory subunit